MLIREDEKGALLFQFEQKIYGMPHSPLWSQNQCWHWGRVSAALLRILHKILFFRHAAWVYADDFLFFFPSSTAPLQFALAVICFRRLGTPLSWKKLEFGPVIEWNGWSIHIMHMTASLPSFKVHKIQQLISNLQQHPCRKNLEKIIGILWATSLAHHARYLLTSLYHELFAFPATNYSIKPTLWEHFLEILNDDATITKANKLHLPIGAKVAEFRHLLLKTNFLKMFQSKGTFGSVFEILTPTNESHQRNPKAHYFGLFIPCYHYSPLSRSIAFVLSTYRQPPMHVRQMILWDGGWVTIPTGTFWFSETWTKSNLTEYITVEKELQRYITSWEAMAQLCIILIVHQQCEPRPGLLNIQSGSDNTGAEANRQPWFLNDACSLRNHQAGAKLNHLLECAPHSR